MSDTIGFKISLPGYPVETATPEQCSVHSAYDSLKIKQDNTNPQEGNILVTFNDTPGAGTYNITTVNYSYGYLPACYFFFDVRNSSYNTGTEVGNFFSLDEEDNAFFEVLVGAQSVTFNLVITPSSTDVLAGEYFAFRYYIFANDGV